MDQICCGQTSRSDNIDLEKQDEQDGQDAGMDKMKRMHKGLVWLVVWALWQDGEAEKG